MHPHDIHQSFLSEINPSLVDRMFAEKEYLDTTDRFLWRGRIQKCDIIAKVTKNYVLFLISERLIFVILCVQI